MNKQDNRIAFIMRLKEGCQAEYERRHDAIWPQLKEVLTQAGVYDYSIFLEPSSRTLFAFQRNHGTSGSQDLGSDPIVRQWWAYMADLMEVNDDLSPLSMPLTEVFHMD